MDVIDNSDPLANERLLSTVSDSYESLKETGLYYEKIIYEKRFSNENRDSIVTSLLGYLNLGYFLNNMDFETFVGLQSYFCHGLIAVFFFTVLMVITRRPDTITLSGQRRLVTKFFSFIIVASAKCF